MHTFQHQLDAIQRQLNTIQAQLNTIATIQLQLSCQLNAQLATFGVATLFSLLGSLSRDYRSTKID
jgi:hypothetical protein